MPIPSPRRFQDLLKRVSAAFGAIAVSGAIGCAITEVSAEPLHGIQHVLYLAVSAGSDSYLREQDRGGKITAKLTVSVLVSAHSQETDFYGVVHTDVPEFDLSKGSRSQEIWRDQKCHHERGFPKITVTNIDGLVQSSQQTNPVAARTRKLGLLLPSDEVLASRRVGDGTDGFGSYIETQTGTRKSGLSVDLKLYVLQCDLQPSPVR